MEAGVKDMKHCECVIHAQGDMRYFRQQIE